MTTNYVPCAKCGKPAKALSHYVPPVTWNGGLVCVDCTRELQGRERRPDGGLPAQSQQGYFGKG